MGGVTIDLSPKNHTNPTKIDLNTTKYTYNGASLVEYINPEYLHGYKQCVHTPNEGNKFDKISGPTDFKTTGLDGIFSGAKSVSVYYWIGDTAGVRPLLIQLDNSEEHCYLLDKSNQKWEKRYVNRGDLSKKLDKQNCNLGKLHHINITRVVGGDYNCPSCGVVPISVTATSYAEYTVCIYKIGQAGTGANDKFGSIDVVHYGHADIPIPYGTKVIHVYFYPVSGEGRLVYFPEADDDKKWFQREYGYGTNWSSVEKPPDPNKSEQILPLLKEAYSKQPMSTGTVAGIVAGSAVGVGILGFVGWKVASAASGSV